jgi:integrase
MHVAALSGMRIEEIYRLTVADCANGWFRIRHAKTRAGVRRVPVHSALTTIGSVTSRAVCNTSRSLNPLIMRSA